MHSMDLIENYTALWIAVEYGVTVETAFRALDCVINGKKITVRIKALSDRDIDDMIKFNEEEQMSYREIAEIYGVCIPTVSNKIKQRKKERSGGYAYNT